MPPDPSTTELLTAVRIELARLGALLGEHMNRSSENTKRVEQYEKANREAHDEIHKRITSTRVQVAAIVGGLAAVVTAVEIIQNLRGSSTLAMLTVIYHWFL